MENPDINYIGTEKYSSVPSIRAIERCEEIEVSNSRFISEWKQNISVMFSKR